jgi:hypothetical protein
MVAAKAKIAAAAEVEKARIIASARIEAAQNESL